VLLFARAIKRKSKKGQICHIGGDTGDSFCFSGCLIRFADHCRLFLYGFLLIPARRTAIEKGQTNSVLFPIRRVYHYINE
jgi:hypothetical protein